VGKWRVRRKIYTSMAHFKWEKTNTSCNWNCKHEHMIILFQTSYQKLYDIEWNQSIALRIHPKAFFKWQMLEKSEGVPKEYGKNLVQVN